MNLSGAAQTDALRGDVAAGRVHIAQDASGQVWVGGDSVTCIDGSVNL